MTKILNRKGWVAVGVYSLILLAGGFYAGNRNFSEKTTVVEKEKSKETVDIVEKIVENPDGTKTTWRTRKETVKKDASKKAVIVKKDNDYLVGLSYNLGGVFGVREVYTLSVDKKVFSNAYAGIYATNTGEYGVGIKMSF